MADFYSDPANVLILVIGMFSVILLVIAIYASRYQRVPPDKAMIIYGRTRGMTYSYMEDGKERTATRMVGYRIVRGGGAFIAPIIERIGWLPLESTTLESKLTGIRTKGGAIITVELMSQVGIKVDESSLRAASEHYLDKSASVIAETARKVLESRARTILTDMTLDEINSDRKATELKMGEDINTLLNRSGLAVSVLILKDVCVEKDAANIVAEEDIKPGDLFKVVKNSRGELIVQKMTGGVEG